MITMPTVLSPTGKPIDCRDEDEAERVRAWAAWVQATRDARDREARARRDAAIRETRGYAPAFRYEAIR